MPLVWTALALAAIALLIALTRPARRRRRAVMEALAAASECAASHPGDLDARVRLVEIHLSLTKDFAAAHAQLENVLAKDPHHWAPSSRPTRLLLADAAAARGRNDAAITALREFVAACPHYAARVGGDSERKHRLATCVDEAERRLRAHDSA